MYGYRKPNDDLCELGGYLREKSSRRLMQAEGLRSQMGYRRRYGFSWREANRCFV
ncbi:hypothetical protein [Pseudomonas putida]|uniref:hypothetical protein n=1 Tax=Pseudomonas putida TaxID=303 RepID=UPI00351ECD72